jgi:hypothetical protein
MGHAEGIGLVNQFHETAYFSGVDAAIVGMSLDQAPESNGLAILADNVRVFDMPCIFLADFNLALMTEFVVFAHEFVVQSFVVFIDDAVESALF